MSSDITLAVVGLGHVGLPTALGFAELGWRVLGADQDSTRAARLRAAQAPFFEPGLGELLADQLESGRFRVVETEEAVRNAGVIFICVDTPQRGDGNSDLTNIETVTRAVAGYANGYTLLVQKSTAPVHTSRWMADLLRRVSRNGHEVEVAVNPEFLQEGTAVHDVRHPDRVIIGVESERARRILQEIYRPMGERLPRPGTCAPCDDAGRRLNGHWLVVTDPATAEIAKHASNAFLTTRISFINIVADLCEATGADVTKVAQAMGLDPRIGLKFLQPGVGFGGACLPKDLGTFIRMLERHGVDATLPRATAAVNHSRIPRVVERLRGMAGDLEGKTVGILGLAFKPRTDDVREAPSLKIARALLAAGASLQVHDPEAAGNFVAALASPERVRVCHDPYEAARDAHAVVLVTEWEEYRNLDLARLKSGMVTPILLDGRNVFDPLVMRSHGFTYESIGRP